MAERTLHFNSLPPSIRQRLVRIFSQKEECKPYVVRPMEPPAAMGVLLLITCAGIWYLFFRSKPIGLPKWEDTAWMTLAAFCACYCAYGYWRGRRTRAALPFPPGDYLFSTDVIEARSDVLNVFPMVSCTEVKAVHQIVNGVYSYTTINIAFPGRNFPFVVAGREKAEVLLLRLNADRAMLQDAITKGDWVTILALDPLFEVRSGNLWAQAAQPPHDVFSAPEGQVTAGRVPGDKGRLWKTAAAACVVGPLLATLNGLFFDEMQFRKVTAQGYPTEMREYLTSGWLHYGEVHDEILPERVFQIAKTARSVRGLRNYIREFPNHRSVAEARDEIHTLYAAALKELRDRSAPEAAGFLTALLKWLEENESPTVSVCFARPTASALATVDRELAAKGGAIDGMAVAPVSPSFTDLACETRELEIVKSLNAGFHEVVPQFILNLALGPRLARPDEPQSVPILAIAYAIAPSGSLFSDKSQARGFVGVQVTFSLALSSPGTAPLRFAVDVQPPDHFTVKFTRKTPGDSSRPADDTVYDVMASKAFEQLDAKLHDVFFRKSDATAGIIGR